MISNVVLFPNSVQFLSRPFHHPGDGAGKIPAADRPKVVCPISNPTLTSLFRSIMQGKSAATITVWNEAAKGLSSLWIKLSSNQLSRIVPEPGCCRRPQALFPLLVGSSRIGCSQRGHVVCLRATPKIRYVRGRPLIATWTSSSEPSACSTDRHMGPVRLISYSTCPPRP